MENNGSNLTLRKSFFDVLWPLILEYNRCDTHSKNTSEFFVARRPFDDLCAHTYLAKKCYNGYQKPIELCCSCILTAEENDNHEANETNEPSEDNAAQEESKRCVGKPPITRLLHQIDGVRSAQERRQRLAYKFIHRQYPWYVQLHSFDPITMDYRLQPFELNVLRNVHGFECRLVIIDMASTMRLQTMERWLKFCRYVKVVALVRDAVIARQLLLFDGAFYTHQIEENTENFWHDELLRALDAGYRYARELELLPHCAQTFLFVFANKRGLADCNTFKVLRTL